MFARASAFPGSSTRLERIAGATTDLQRIVHQGLTYTLPRADQSLALSSRIAQVQQDGQQPIVSFGGQAHTSLDVAGTSAGVPGSGLTLLTRAACLAWAFAGACLAFGRAGLSWRGCGRGGRCGGLPRGRPGSVKAGSLDRFRPGAHWGAGAG
jgi:hypothetical protein